MILPCANPGLEGEGKLGEIDEALLAGIRRVVGQGLQHEVGGEAGSLQPTLHPLDGLQGHKGVEMAVDAHHVSTGPGHPGQENKKLIKGTVQQNLSFCLIIIK